MYSEPNCIIRAAVNDLFPHTQYTRIRCCVATGIFVSEYLKYFYVSFNVLLDTILRYVALRCLGFTFVFVLTEILAQMSLNKQH